MNKLPAILTDRRQPAMSAKSWRRELTERLAGTPPRQISSLLSHPGELIVPTKKRTTLRSKTGTKLYAVRDKKGKFKDIQSYKRAHGQDVKRRAKSERSK